MFYILEKINTNICWALLLLLTLILLFHYFFVWRSNLSKKKWKQVDYIWISLTAISLFGATRKAEVTINAAKLNMTHLGVEGRFNLLINNIDHRDSSGLCTKFERLESSPANLDEEQAEYDSTCYWSKNLYQYMVLMDSTDRKPINIDSLAPLNVKFPVPVQYKESIIKLIKFYNEIASEEVQQKAASKQTEYDLMFAFFSPLLLIIALALRLTKVSGEVRHEK